MKKEACFLAIFLITAMLLTSCGGGGGEGGTSLQPPTYNLAGTWDVTDTPLTDTCSSLGSSYTFTVTVVQSPGSNTMTYIDNSTTPPESHDLTVSGTHITYSNTAPSTNCTSLSESWNFTATDASDITGTVSWTCQKITGGSCGGSSSISAIKQNHAPVAPVAIFSFTPASGPVGSPVTITGTGFSATAADNTVKFNGVSAVVSASTTTSISTSVPAGATTGPISVLVSGQTATSATNFTVYSGGAIAFGITGFSPMSGTTGTAVTITGMGFSTTPANNAVTFNGTTALVTASTTTTITTSVPDGATTGPISVLVSGLTATSTAFFWVNGGAGGATAEVEPNNDPMNAQAITVNETISGTTSGSAATGDCDWYTITLSTTGNYSIQIAFGSTGDLNLALLDSNSAPLNFSGTTAFGGTEIITQNITSSGTYYIVVYPVSTTATTSYTLTVLKQGS